MLNLSLLIAILFIALLTSWFAKRGGVWRLRLAVEAVDTPGTTEALIIDRLGPPRSMVLSEEGAIRFDWCENGKSGGYHVAMLFHEGRLLGVSHENYQEVACCR
jgi:hypothetical protein